jgi:hypothetical protein
MIFLKPYEKELFDEGRLWVFVRAWAFSRVTEGKKDTFREHPHTGDYAEFKPVRIVETKLGQVDERVMGQYGGRKEFIKFWKESFGGKWTPRAKAYEVYISSISQLTSVHTGGEGGLVQPPDPSQDTGEVGLTEEEEGWLHPKPLESVVAGGDRVEESSDKARVLPVHAPPPTESPQKRPNLAYLERKLNPMGTTYLEQENLSATIASLMEETGREERKRCIDEMFK